MKPSLLIFLLLNIYSSVFIKTSAQEYTLTIKNKNTLSPGLIDTLQLQNHYTNLETVKQKTDTIYRTLQRMGYIDSEIRGMEVLNDSTYQIDIYFGNRYGSVKIFYSQEDFAKKELQKISSEIHENYFVVPIEKLSSTMSQLAEIRNQKGNAFAKVKLKEIEKDSQNQLTAQLSLANGNIRTVDSIAIQGYEKFPKSFLKHYAGIKKGKVFRKSKLVEQSENLNSLGFVNSVKPPEALFRKDSTVVYFYLEKQNNNIFDGILGFSTDEETQKVEFNGYLNLELNNNLDYGEQFLLNYKADGKEQIQFRAKATLPYLFRTPFGLSGELKIFKRDSSFVTTEQQIRTTYQVSPAAFTYIGYRGFDSSNLLDQTLAGIPIEDFKSSSLLAGANYKKLQNRRLFPIKSYLSLETGIGSRSRKELNETQFSGEMILSNIFNLNNRNSIYAQISGSALFSDTYLVNELFRFGGINSIRGFDENSIDASLFSVINTEYRYQFNEAVFAHSIIDFGYFENQTLSIREKLYSFGLGLGFTTKAGLFRFIAANGVAENQDFNFSNTKIHISVTSRF